VSGGAPASEVVTYTVAVLRGSPTRAATTLPGSAWHGRVAVVSPHLDDAVFSLGASIRAATRRGVAVDVVTVLAGDPSSESAADESNARAGFATAGEAARLRREEDARACAHVGARPVWLDLSDDRAAPVDDATLHDALREALEGYDAVLLPGFPLAHPDHVRVARAALHVLGDGRVVGLYVEQPYASWARLARSGRGDEGPTLATSPGVLGLRVDDRARWRRHRGRPAEWLGKLKGMSAYTSQLRVLRRAPRTRMLVYEALHGGEAVLWVTLR
jgi:LmbE family N-acetylglucosaminyl deacetylase